MSYRDTWATCEECGKQFIFTVEEQRRLDRLGLDVEPGSCAQCRAGSAGTEATSWSPQTAEGEADTAVGTELGEQLGAIKWYEPRKRYGFITRARGDDIFFHRNAIVEGREEDFAEGAEVTFRITESDKGPEAADVKIVKPT
jgi:CspA family cold shock protein